MSTSITRASRLFSRPLCRPASLPELMLAGCDAGHSAKRRRARTWSVPAFHPPPSVYPLPTAPPADAGSEALQRALARIGDLEQRIQFRELEQRLEVVVQVREPKLPTLLSNLLGQGHEHAESGTVDVSGLREVDEKLLLTTLQLVQHLLLQLLPVADDELALDIHNNDFRLLRDREAHEVSPNGT